MKSKNISDKIFRSVKSRGFKHIELPSVIEANHIVQRSGESFRKFLFSFIEFKGSKKNNCMFNLDFEDVVSFKFKLTLGELKSSFA